MRYRPVDEILEAITVLGGTRLGRQQQGWGQVNRGAHKSILASCLGDEGSAMPLVEPLSADPRPYVGRGSRTACCIRCNIAWF